MLEKLGVTIEASEQKHIAIAGLIGSGFNALINRPSP